MTDEQRAGDDGFHLTAKQLGGIAALVIALLFVIQNTQTVRVNFLFLHVDVQMWLLLLVMFLLGGIVGALLWHRRNRRG